MTVHYGIHPNAGYCSYFDESKKTSINFTTRPVNFNEIEKVNLFLQTLKPKINGKLGNACIYLSQDYGNGFRKRFIECGLKNGFKNVEIINLATAFYLNAMSQINYKPLNGNVIWIHNSFNNFYVWEINNQKAKFCGEWMADSSKLNDLQKIVDESKLRRTLARFYYDTDYWPSKGCLLKARINAGDSELTHLQTIYFLSQTFSLKIGNNVITTFEETQQLPIFFTKTIIKNSKNDTLKVNDTPFEMPEYSPVFLTFTIDRNEIFSITFDVKPDVNEIGDESHLSINNKSDKHSEKSMSKNVTTLSSYSIPKVHAPFNNGKNAIINASNKHNENSISKTVKTLSFYSIPKVQTPFNTEKNAIGIDLGTSRCCVAVIRKNGITTVPLDNTGERLLPSYVSYDEENVKCGQIVVERLRNYSKSTIFDSKRIIGRNLSDIEIDSYWPFGISETNSKVYLEVEKFDGKATVFPEEVSAALLKHIKQKTEEFQGKPLSKAVITVPAAFNDTHKNATLEAAKIAGWKEIILLPEPIAAAFAYFNDRSISNNSNVLLFDLGGGTLDVCIFKIQNNQIEIISNTGDSKFGGRDFDTVLINYFKNALSTKYGISFVKHKKYLLMVKCQKIKETLSVLENAGLDVDDFDTTQEGNIQISQEGFQKMCEPLLKRVKNTLNAALHNSKFDANQINKVLHVGGGSRMPMIKKLLRNMFPKAEHCTEEHPDEVVAIGAAYYAYSLHSDS